MTARSLTPSEDIKLRRSLGQNRQAQILYALKTAIEPKTTLQIANKTGITLKATRKNLIYLMRQGKVTRSNERHPHTWEIVDC